MTDVAGFERALAAALEQATGPGVRCPATVADLRLAAVEYLNEYDAELDRLPELTREGHWNLWAWDGITEYDGESYFVAMMVWPDGLEFACGRGEQYAVRDFADSDFPDDIRQAVPELIRRFSVPTGGLRVARPVAEQWLGRGLGLHH